MVEYIAALVISGALGFLAGMGVGGGSLLLLWLTQVVGLPQPQARILNLLFFLPAAITATLLHKAEYKPDRKIVYSGILAGCASAALFSLLSRFLDVELMKKMLGGLLVFTGLREIFYRPRKAK